MDLIQKLIQKTRMSKTVIQSIIKLLDEGNTIPFIARYRKETTEGASDEQLRNFHEIYEYTKNLEKRKEDVIRLINEKGLLTKELQNEINASDTLARVEDFYRPFKEKKNTKATIAKYRGLEPLANLLKNGKLSKDEFESKAKEFVQNIKDKRKDMTEPEKQKAGELFTKYK